MVYGECFRKRGNTVSTFENEERLIFEKKIPAVSKKKRGGYYSRLSCKPEAFIGCMLLESVYDVNLILGLDKKPAIATDTQRQGI